MSLILNTYELESNSRFRHEQLMREAQEFRLAKLARQGQAQPSTEPNPCAPPKQSLLGALLCYLRQWLKPGQQGFQRSLLR
jgi:hypothetical protein